LGGNKGRPSGKVERSTWERVYLRRRGRPSLTQKKGGDSVDPKRVGTTEGGQFDEGKSFLRSRRGGSLQPSKESDNPPKEEKSSAAPGREKKGKSRVRSSGALRGRIGKAPSREKTARSTERPRKTQETARKGILKDLFKKTLAKPHRKQLSP